MRKYFIYILTAVAALSGCNKSALTEQVATKPEGEPKMSVSIFLGEATRDNAGIMTPVGQNGHIWLDAANMYLICVPVDGVGNPDYDNTVTDIIGLHTEKNNTLVGMTSKTTDEWFSISPTGNCLFFATIATNIYRNSYQIDVSAYNHETGEYDSTNEHVPMPRLFVETIDGQKTILPILDLSNSQETYVENYRNFGDVYRDVDHIVGASSVEPVNRAYVKERDNILGLSRFAPATAMLRFNVKSTSEIPEGTWLTNIRISMKTGGVNKGANDLTGYTFVDFRNYQSASNPFTLIPAGNLDITPIEVPSHKTIDEYGVETIDSYRYLYTNYTHEYLSCSYRDERRGRHEEEYGGPISETPSDYYFLVTIIPQSAEVAANSTMVFRAYDKSGNLFATTEKPFPAGGFVGGNQYEFTLNLNPTVSSWLDTNNAGEYGINQW